MTHTKDRLADELQKLGLDEMSAKARTGHYDDFLSTLDTPIIQLVNDLEDAARARLDRSARIRDLRRRAINGDFDATKEESDTWAASPDGQAAFAKLIRKE